MESLAATIWGSGMEWIVCGKCSVKHCPDCYNKCVGCGRRECPSGHDCDGCAYACCGFCLAKKEKKDADEEVKDRKNWKKWSEEKLVEKVKEHLEGKDDQLTKDWREDLPFITDLAARIISRLSKISPTMRAHYVDEILAISRDLARDVNLDADDDQELTLLIMCLLQFRDDDDDDEKDAPDLPKIGDLATV